MVTAVLKLKTLAPWKESYNKPRQHIKKQRHHFATKDLYSQSYSFPSSHIQMWELDHKEGWVPNNWCFWTVLLEKTLRVPWTARRSNQSILKKINSWVFTGRIDVAVGASVLWPPDMSSWLIGEDPDTGKGWRQKKMGAVEDEMVR